jgi:hypothetical protein
MWIHIYVYKYIYIYIYMYIYTLWIVDPIWGPIDGPTGPTYVHDDNVYLNRLQLGYFTKSILYIHIREQTDMSKIM